MTVGTALYTMQAEAQARAIRHPPSLALRASVSIGSGDNVLTRIDIKQLRRRTLRPWKSTLRLIFGPILFYRGSKRVKPRSGDSQ